MTKPELTDRELDAWLAKNLMGLAVIPDEVPGYYTPVGAKAFDADLLIPQYSTDLVAAFELVEKMRENKFGFKLDLDESNWRDIELYGPPQYSAGFGKIIHPLRHDTFVVHRIDKIPKAIALAAKKATESNL